MSNRIAKIIVNPEFIVEALHLPEGTKLLDIDWGDYGYLLLAIESESLDELVEGKPIPIVSVVLETHVVYEIKFKEWHK